MSLRKLIPWQAKILSKLLLSRVPSSYLFWQWLGLFRHGEMDDPAYAYGVFCSHYDQSNFARKGKGFVALELGPGDSLFSAQIGYVLGAGASYLVDAGRFAKKKLDPYRRMEAYLGEKGLVTPVVSEVKSLEGLLESCRASYLCEGLKSLREIPDGSVDFIWSHAVLEHVRKAEFNGMLREMRRIIRADGECSHRIDLMDHLGGALNNLRFSEAHWESDWMADAGFYTNRIRYGEMLKFFDDAGFEVVVRNVQSWKDLPTPRRAMAQEFASLPDCELTVSAFDVTLRPK